jgi:hypothetical protein
MRLLLASSVVALVLSGAAAARAETCPDIPATETSLRRSMAKEWFAKAEEAETSGDKPAAVRRYACSLGLTPHPSTAYNLGTVAEKSGDWSMAIEGFRTYLKLSPEAPDRPTVETRIAALEAKLAELRKDLQPKETPAAEPVVPPPIAPPIPPPPPSPDQRAHGRHVAGWITLASSLTAVGGGVALNLVARSKVDECYRQWSSTGSNAALDRCDEAKPFAYGSYALFGVGGALGATSLLLLLWPTGDAPAAGEAAPQVSHVSIVPTAGGGAAFVTGRF